MALIKQGEVFLVNFDPIISAEAKKTLPAVVVSNDINNAHSPIVSICYQGREREPKSGRKRGPV